MYLNVPTPAAMYSVYRIKIGSSTGTAFLAQFEDAIY